MTEHLTDQKLKGYCIKIAKGHDLHEDLHSSTVLIILERLHKDKYIPTDIKSFRRYFYVCAKNNWLRDFVPLLQDTSPLSDKGYLPVIKDGYSKEEKEAFYFTLDNEQNKKKRIALSKMLRNVNPVSSIKHELKVTRDQAQDIYNQFIQDVRNNYYIINTNTRYIDSDTF